MWLVDVSIRRPVFAVMLVGSLVVLGLVSFSRLGIDLFPRIDMPFVSVSAVLEGASPDTVETEITDVLEGEVNTISGIRQMRSVSAEGLALVNIEFELEEQSDVKAQEVRDKVDIALRDLPRDVEAPVVEKVDPDASPILSVMLSGSLPIERTTTYADEVVKEALERIPGVGSVTLVGGRKRQMRVWLDAGRMRASGVTADEVVATLTRENAELPGGRMELDGRRGELGARTIGRVHSAAEFARLVVTHRANGGVTRIGDVARVEDAIADELSYAQLSRTGQVSGAPGVALEVRRQSGRNTVAIARAVRAEVERLARVAPAGVDMVVARDVSRFIESSIADLLVDIVLAVALVVAITFVFLLEWRATLIVALASPTSLVATFVAFGAFYFTINMITLLALTVTIGLLVDYAIVVIEAIQRDIDAGNDPRVAAASATRRVAVAVLAGTFATLAVFVPIGFMEGIVGRFFQQYGLTIVFAVAVSLLVALTLTPMLASRFLSRAAHSDGLGSGLLARIAAFHLRLEARYGRLVEWAVRRRGVVLIGAFASVLLGGALAANVPSTFMSSTDRSEFLATVKLPLGTGIAGARSAAARVDAALRSVDEVELVFVTVGAGAQQRTHQLDVYVGLSPKALRPQHQAELMDAARRALTSALPEAREVAVEEVPWVSGGGIGQTAVELVIMGTDLRAIERHADTLGEAMRADAAFADVRSSYEGGRPELQLRIDRDRAADLGVSARALAATTQVALGGVDAGTFESGGRRYDVRVRLEEAQRQTPAHVLQLQVRSANGALVDVGSVTDATTADGPVQIDRKDRARKISVSANTATGHSLSELVARLDALQQAHPLPEGITTVMEGQARRMSESVADILFAFMLGLVALYIVLATQFDSFGQPVVIMLTAPLSFSGAFAALLLGGQELSLFGQIGLVALMGIVMKNGVLLVDRANQLRAEGFGRIDAITRAAPERLRPVLMTALAAVFGMLPVAFATSDGAEWRNPMGFIIVGGLTTSTILTLLVIPAAYALPEDAKRLMARIRGRRDGKSEAAVSVAGSGSVSDTHAQ